MTPTPDKNPPAPAKAPEDNPPAPTKGLGSSPAPPLDDRLKRIEATLELHGECLKRAGFPPELIAQQLKGK